MRLRLFLPGALTTASLLFCGGSANDPQIREGVVDWFSLSETKQTILRILGPPANVVDFGSDFQSWQYHIDGSDHHEFSHLLVFRRSSGTLVSVTRNYEEERPVDALFPTSETRTYSYPSAEKPQYSLRLRRLPGGRLLMAMGVSGPGRTTGQIMLIRDSEIRYIYPWLSKQLD